MLHNVIQTVDPDTVAFESELPGSTNAFIDLLKEELCTLFSLCDPQQAESAWKAWFSAAKERGISSLVRFAELKDKRIDGLISHASFPISTGKLEGFNNKIKVAKRIGYGYRDDAYFFSLIRYLALPSVRSPVPKFP